MSQYLSESLRTEVKGEYDVIVVGGGPAGIGAALAAARQGMSTLIIERFNCMGGMWTSGLVNPLFDYENKGGIVQEIVDGINAAGMQSSSGHMYTFDMEYMKVLLDRMLLDAGASMLFHTYFCAPVMEGERIAGVVVENKGGRAAYRAKVVIDCTGDGDVAARAGAPWKMGREEDGKFQPMTLMFKLGNADYVQQYPYPYGNHCELFALMEKAVKDAGLEDYDYNFTKPCLLRLPGQHTGVMQMTHVRGLSAINPEELTQAEIQGRELVQDAMDFFHKYLPQLQNAQLDQTAAMIGVRETRRIMGQYEITFDDLKSGSTFDDGFCTCKFGVDIHEPDGKGQAHDRVAFHTKPYQLPYRSLVPQGVGQLLIAGRCISADYIAHSAHRVTGDCVAMGQAAGTAAALAIGKGIAPAALDGRLVVERMVADGARTA